MDKNDIIHHEGIGNMLHKRNGFHNKLLSQSGTRQGSLVQLVQSKEKLNV